MHKQISFLITAAILIAAVSTVALYTVNVANAQSANMTKNATAAGGNMTKNATAAGGNMTKNATAAGGNMTKTK
jgi:hypothetical protein